MRQWHQMLPLIHDAIVEVFESGKGIFSRVFLFYFTRVGFHSVVLEGNKNKLWMLEPHQFILFMEATGDCSAIVSASLPQLVQYSGQGFNQLHLPPPALRSVSLSKSPSDLFLRSTISVNVGCRFMPLSCLHPASIFFPVSYSITSILSISFPSCTVLH